MDGPTLLSQEGRLFATFYRRTSGVVPLPFFLAPEIHGLGTPRRPGIRLLCSSREESSAYPHLKSTKDRRKELRGNLTPVEALLWKCLQRSQLAGKKFRRQHARGPFIVDFYCTECRLGVELDGAGHKTILGNERDAARDLFLARFNVRILRFENRLVRENLQGVLEAIKHALLQGPTPC